MISLTLAFLKIFFRNKRAIFFVILFPTALFLMLALLRFEQIIRFAPDQSYIDFLLSGIVAFAVMQMGVYTAAYSLIDYHRQKVLKRLAVTPLSAARFLLAQGFSRFIMAMIQTGLLIGLGSALFVTDLGLTAIFAPLVILFGTIIFLNFGSIIASLARDYEEAAPYTAVAGLGMSFFGDVFFPAANLPVWLQNIAAVLPMKPFVGLLRYSFFGIGQNEALMNLLIVLGWLTVSTLAAKIIFSKRAYR
ncbi:MAG: hypothetical protein A2846_02885 [Candidatus Doudnabacteria bacterium RIFCSPHIGHO2_01_FULL_49_9]|uniref:Transport permease protein n=1 Tax=Candidatus Doudnabacteria bacterium RIFCSPHIGHO2_01_FULL_49_9 TaxID=1817827 RepID=A0A1F5NY10_9BACT|nr:MAG: hypothetical protein A2846_02885 [Candidatus Doudnabacteria bacterium RIFCSPHIGHO2_01_FULL_49_9]